MYLQLFSFFFFCYIHHVLAAVSSGLLFGAFVVVGNLQTQNVTRRRQESTERRKQFEFSKKDGDNGLR